MELECVQSTSALDPIQLDIVAIGGEFTSIDRGHRHDDEAVASIRDRSPVDE